MIEELKSSLIKQKQISQGVQAEYDRRISILNDEIIQKTRVAEYSQLEVEECKLLMGKLVDERNQKVSAKQKIEVLHHKDKLKVEKLEFEKSKLLLRVALMSMELERKINTNMVN